MIRKASIAVEAVAVLADNGLIHRVEYSIENAIGSPSLGAGLPSDTLSIYDLRKCKLYGCAIDRRREPRMDRFESLAWQP